MTLPQYKWRAGWVGIMTISNEHKQRYPAQYEHPLCGKNVKVVTLTGLQTIGIVERVVPGRLGPLAILKGADGEAWSVNDCHIQTHTERLGR